MMKNRAKGAPEGTPEGTPYLSIDGTKMRRNILKLANVAKEGGVTLRPHATTHKIPSIAKDQLKAGAKGITGAKLSEAEVMADAGIEDTFIAYPLVADAKITGNLQDEVYPLDEDDTVQEVRVAARGKVR